LCLAHQHECFFQLQKNSSTKEKSLTSSCWRNGTQLFIQKLLLCFILIGMTLLKKWSTSNNVDVKYIATTWLLHKDKIICCWTSQYMHLGTVSSSRDEGNHFVDKKNLKNCKCISAFGGEELEFFARNPVYQIECRNGIGKEKCFTPPKIRTYDTINEECSQVQLR
jgi:hypothetical protein